MNVKVTPKYRYHWCSKEEAEKADIEYVLYKDYEYKENFNDPNKWVESTDGWILEAIEPSKARPSKGGKVRRTYATAMIYTAFGRLLPKVKSRVVKNAHWKEAYNAWYTDDTYDNLGRQRGWLSSEKKKVIDSLLITGNKVLAYKLATDRYDIEDKKAIKKVNGYLKQTVVQKYMSGKLAETLEKVNLSDEWIFRKYKELYKDARHDKTKLDILNKLAELIGTDTKIKEERTETLGLQFPDMSQTILQIKKSTEAQQAIVEKVKEQTEQRFVEAQHKVVEDE